MANEVTDEQRTAASNQTTISKHDANALKTQAEQQLGNYDMANQQNRSLADVERRQNERKLEADRFAAYRDLLSSMTGLTGSIGPALAGSVTGNLLQMAANRNDKDNANYWAQHQQNQDQVENEYQQSANANQVAKNDALITTQKGLADVESQQSANLNNINSSLFAAPGTGDADQGANGYYQQHKVDPLVARLSGYIMPDDSAQAAYQARGRNRVGRAGGGYYSRLLNSYNTIGGSAWA